MRKFFSFRSSSAPSGEKEKTLPSAPKDENVYWETPGENVSRNAEGADVRIKKQTSKASSGSPHLRRSLSFSSSTPYSSWVDGQCDSGCANLPHRSAERPIHCLPMTPERLPKSKRDSQGTIHKSHAFEKPDSPTSSRGHHGLRGNSPYSSPVPFRCKSSRVTQSLNANNILDLYVDGEHHERRFRKDSQPSLTVNDGSIVEKRTLPSFGRPPKARDAAPSSPTSSKESLRSCSFREDKDVTHSFSALYWAGDDFRLRSPKKHSRKVIERQLCTLHGKSRMKVPDSESQTTTTTTIEDMYEDSSNNNMQNCTFSDHISGDKKLNGYCTEEAPSFHERSHSLCDDLMGIRHENSLFFRQQNEDVDAGLLRKLKEAEKKIEMLTESDTDSNRLWSGKLGTSGLVHMIRNMIEERKNLASELSSQIRCRISERSSTIEALKQAKKDFDTRTRRLEKEKNELQLSLEKELDRRSTDWSFKLEKFQAEEQRLRERVRELAEQNVSLQREVSSLSEKEMEARSRIMNSEAELNVMTTRLEEMRNENSKLQQAVSELQEQCNMAEADQDCVKRKYKEKEKETKELQKAVAKLQTICGEQEKTITGLRQGYVDQVGKQSQEGGDLVSKLQKEHIRLTSVEQTLRKEVASFTLEVESLRKENLYILGRLKCTGSSCGFSLIRIEQELCTQIEFLQSKTLSLLDDGIELSGKLLKAVNSKQYECGHVAIHELDGYSAAEYDMKLQSLKRAANIVRGRLQSMSEMLDQRSKLGDLELQSQKTVNDLSRQCDVTSREDEMELELKAETLLTRLLRENLFYKEQELEQLQSELGSSVCGNELLKSETQRLQDELSCLTHKTKDMELQMLKRDKMFNQLEHDLQECMKELTISRDMLPRVSEERDRLWEEVKQSKETNMLLDYEVKSLRKKVEALDEDILIKEGQITMLKDSLGYKPFDIIYSPSAMKERSSE
uniref:FYVE and coiled-coil domain-containing protein 1 n=1 Tax=Anthurium amnicola TaxID=1678845 RepID=A0A1D1YTD6_9ARAE